MVEEKRMPEKPEEKTLLDREAEFWDRQEESIDALYERPHDWRFIPPIAEKVIGPRIDFVKELITRHRDSIDSVLDIGCGNGWFCHAAAEAGIRAIGVDLSPKKVETARSEAKRRGLTDLCTFESGDIMEVELPEKVSLLTAHGSLHHFPELDLLLPEMVDRFLKPDGFMLFSEPHHEGMSPGLQKFIMGLARRWPFKNLFDLEFYNEVTGGAAEAEASSGDDYNLRGESPAGLEFFGEEPDMGKILSSKYKLTEERYFNYISGHLTNAFYVYMLSKPIRGIYRLLLPLVVMTDTLACRAKRYSRFAEEGVWFLENKPPE